MDVQNILSEALHYQTLGFSIIPVGRNKRPLIDWKRYQTKRATSEQIIIWFKQFPEMNIGVATGAVSGIVVIDIEKDGSTKGFLPTVTSRTGGGGWHLFYKHPGVLVKNSARKIAPLTDIRGDGGYVVVAPSLHQSGKRYEWQISPDDAGFEELPQWILEKCTDDPEVKKDWEKFSTNQVVEGMRNDTATSYAGKLLHDLSPDLWESAGWISLKDWNSTHAKPPLLESELRAVFESIGQKEKEARNKKFSGGKTRIARGKALVSCLADIQPEPISWLWPGRIALGKLTLIAGDPGLGKSLLTTTLAASVSKGYPWPIEGSLAPVGDVVLLSAEDDAADTIRPRLDAAGADCSRVHILKSIQEIDVEDRPTQRMFSFKRDMMALEELLASLPNCRLLIVDPVSAYLDGTDSNNNSDIRGLLAPLAELAAHHKVAAISISHLNKSGIGNALYRTMGSLAFTAAARAAYIVTKDKDNPERRLLMPAKNNLAKDNTGLAYSVVTAENGAPVIAWESEPVMITADEALAVPESNDERTDTDWAVDYLRDLLSNGPIQASEVQKGARQIGVSKKSLRRAQEKLSIKPQKTSFEGGWSWSLPTRYEGVQDTPSKTVGTLVTLGEEGNLRGRPDHFGNF